MAFMRVSALVFASLLAACQGSPNPTTAQDAFLERVGLTTYASVTFEDESGAEVTYETFSALVKGRAFSITKDTGSSQAVVQIQSEPTQADAEPLAEPVLAIAPGDLVPELANADLNGNAITFSSKPTLVSFFFAECAPCIKEVPRINSLMIQLPNVQFVSITFDDKEIAATFVEQYGLETAVGYGEQSFIDAMGVKAYPLFALVGIDGRLLGVQSGALLQMPMGETLLKEWIESKLGT